ncbi:MAG TPA: hypothetical protein VG165_04625, partial [Solirubrobacteraceae bacterium]|nr:hypothetical protein [Solirubrobacteraceae bacterium]
DAVACDGTTACWAVGQDSLSQAVVVPIDGPTVGAAEVVPGAEFLTGVACGGVGLCEAVGYNSTGQGVVVALTGGAAGPAQVAQGTFDLDGVACVTPGICEAVGSNPANQGVVVAITHGIPGIARAVAGSEFLDGVACPDAETCRAVGFTTTKPQRGLVVSIVAGNPRPASPVAGTSTLGGVACRSRADCDAVGASSSAASSVGLVVPITGGIPLAARQIPPSVTMPQPPLDTSLQGVTCPATTVSCEAVGTSDHHSDSSLRGVAVAITTPGVFVCTTTITGSHTGTLTVASGATCLIGALLNGSIDVRPGAALHVTSSTILGSIVADAPSSIQLCRAHVQSSVSVSGATGSVIIGDPLDQCTGNYIGGSLTLDNNAHGVKVGGNQVNGNIPVVPVHSPQRAG